MIELSITTRAALAALWLPWCVSRDDPEQVVNIDSEPERRDRARQLRVGSLDEETTRVALRDNKGADSTELIETLADDYRRLAQHGRLTLAPQAHLHSDHWPQVFSLPEGPMLHETCHRSCALYLSSAEDFELRALVQPLSASWTVYDHPSLRSE